MSEEPILTEVEAQGLILGNNTDLSNLFTASPMAGIKPFLRIVSNGDPTETIVYDSEGRPLDGITEVSWRVGIDDLYAEATVRFTNVQVDVVGQLKQE